MNINLPGPIAAACSVMELGVLFTAAYIWFRQRGLTPAGAGAYAVISGLMWLSFVFQFFFYLGRPELSLIPEILVTAGGALYLFRQRGLPLADLKTIAGLARAYPLVTLGAMVILGYLILSGLVLPPSSNHWDDLVLVLNLEKGRSLFTSTVPLPPLNHLILSHLFLRFGTDVGLGLLGGAAYLAIGLTTYTLARRFSWTSTAFTVTLVAMSMPRLLLMAGTPNPEIMAAATACFCLLTAFRAVEQQRLFDLLLLVLGILFSISGKAVPLAFPAVMAALAGILLFRRHGARSWLALLKRRWKLSALILLPVPIFSQILVFYFNQVNYRTWPYPAESAGLPINQDGFTGGLANLGRYLFQSADFTRPLDLLTTWAAHFSLTKTMLGLYRVIIVPVFGSRGAAATFAVNWAPEETMAWFGPLAFFLILPAVLYALIKGNRRLKATALALCGYVYLVCLMMAWGPGNAAYFTVFFACAGFLPAFFLPPWRFTGRAKRRLGAICFLLMVYVIACNTQRPLIGPGNFRLQPTEVTKPLSPTSGLPGPNEFQSGIWTWTDWGRDRLAPARLFFGDDRVEVFKNKVPAGAVVGLAGQDRTLYYPFLLARPDLTLKPMTLDEVESRPALMDSGLDYLVLVDSSPDALPPNSGRIRLWSAEQEARYPGALIKVR